MKDKSNQAKPGKKLKILCMHGLGTNKQFMKKQTAVLRQDLQEIAEFIYIDAPFQFPLTLIRDPRVLKNLVGKPYSWFDFRTSHKTRSNEKLFVDYEAIKVAIEAGSDHYDGAFCFSQGSFAFQVVLWEHLRGSIRWPIIENIKFFISFSADLLRLNLKSQNYKRLQIPSFHFLSQQDFLFNKCLYSPTFYKNPQILFHSFGHKFPVLGIHEMKLLTNFIRRHGFKEEKQSSLSLSSL